MTARFQKILRLTALTLLVGLVAIQFIRPAQNLATGPQPHDIAAKYAVPADVHGLLQRACYDCHSNTTKYPWYAAIQPVAWWLDAHVRDGKRHLNFSEFGGLTTKRAVSKLDEVIAEVEDGRMPLKSYTPMHPEARLTPDDIKKLVAWAEALSDELAAN